MSVSREWVDGESVRDLGKAPSGMRIYCHGRDAMCTHAGVATGTHAGSRRARVQGSRRARLQGGATSWTNHRPRHPGQRRSVHPPRPPGQEIPMRARDNERLFPRYPRRPWRESQAIRASTSSTNGCPGVIPAGAGISTPAQTTAPRDPAASRGMTNRLSPATSAAPVAKASDDKGVDELDQRQGRIIPANARISTPAQTTRPRDPAASPGMTNHFSPATPAAPAAPAAKVPDDKGVDELDQRLNRIIPAKPGDPLPIGGPIPEQLPAARGDDAAGGRTVRTRRVDGAGLPSSLAMPGYPATARMTPRLTAHRPEFRVQKG